MERWEDRSTFSIQTNNSAEAINRKRRDLYRKEITKVLLAAGVAKSIIDTCCEAIKGWLENCGPTAMLNILDVGGYETKVKFPGEATIQSEDALAIWMNDKVNEVILRKARPDLDPSTYLLNEIPQYYPAAIKALYKAVGRFVPMITFQDLGRMLLDRSIVGAMICLKNPGHFLGVVHYDSVAKELIYRDPWPGRTGTSGFNLRMRQAEWLSNVRSFAVVVYPPIV